MRRLGALAIRHRYAPAQVTSLGRDALMAREREVLAQARSVQSKCVRPVLVNGAIVVVRWVFQFEWLDGRTTRMEELAYQRWEGERIAAEQFFYDPSQLVPRSPENKAK